MTFQSHRFLPHITAFQAIYLVVCLLVVFTPPCFQVRAQPLAALSLEEARALAVENNPGLRAERQNLGIAEAEILDAGRLPNPSVMSDSGIAEDTYRIGVQQTVELGGKRRKRQALARARGRVMAAQVVGEELRLLAEIREAYARYYLSREKYRLIRERAANYRLLIRTAQAETAIGDGASPLDRIEAALIALSIENQLQEVMLSAEQARNRLSFLLAQPLEESVRLAPPPRLETPLPTPDSLIRIAVENRPDFRELAHEQEVNRQEATLTRALRIPDLTLAAGPDIVVGETDRVEAFVIAQLAIPVFDRQQGPLMALEARREQLAFRRQEAARRVALEVRNAWQACRVNRERVRNFEERLLPRADEMQARARQEDVPLLTLLGANEIALDTYLAYFGALQDYQDSIADLERATGQAQ